MNNISIVGFMSTGKTTISMELSKLLNRQVIDTDLMIERDMNMTISNIFSEYGEDYFRSCETKILETALLSDGAIISTGGGIVLRDENRELMRKNGIIVSLIPDFSVILERLTEARETRPLLNDTIDNIQLRFLNRLPLYKDCDIEISIDNINTPEYFAKEIVGKIKNYRKEV